MNHKTDQIKSAAAILLVSLTLALVWLIEPRGAFLQFLVFPTAAVIGALVTLVPMTDRRARFKRALVAGALVGFLGAFLYLLIIAVILVSLGKTEVLTDSRSTFLMLGSAALLTLCSALGGLIGLGFKKKSRKDIDRARDA